MLVISRKQKQRIMIDLRGVDLSQLSDVDKVLVIEIVEKRGDKIRVGIQAPKGIPVHREEVFVALGRQAPADEPPAIEPLPEVA